MSREANGGKAQDGKTEETKPWERMPAESDKAFAKFCAYRDMGPQRSLAKLRQLHAGEKGWTRGAIEDLCSRWRWVDRAAAWDDEQDRARSEAQTRMIAEMAERQARDGLDMQKLARGAMAKWVKQDPQTGQLVLARQLSPFEVVRLYQAGFQVERLARGEPIERTAVKEEPPAPEEQLTPEQEYARMKEMRDLLDTALYPYEHREGEDED
jgi:hypothetical protein